MKLLLLIVPILALVVFASHAHAEKDVSSARYIAKGCELIAYHTQDSTIWKHLDADTDRQVWMCAGALAATSQIMFIQHAYCQPASLNENGLMLQAVTSYMKRHPEKMNYGMGYVIFLALKEKWPCEKK